MTNKELIELAAKAAGIEIGWDSQGAFLYEPEICALSDAWNPLTDDGDALRLAVKLEIYAIVAADLGVVSARIRNGARMSWRENINDDPYTATRRAIVRAAAEIGRTME